MSLIPSAPLKLGRVPALTHVLPPTSTSRFCPSMSLAPPRLHSRRYPPRLCLDHSHCPVLAPATLAALPSTCAIPDRDVFFVADPISSIASRPHCKHLPRMTPGFGPGLVIPDLWQQEGVRALQQGK